MHRRRVPIMMLLASALFTVAAWGAPFSLEALDAITARVRAMVASELVPVVYVDLDDTVFVNSGRYEFLLREFDAISGTSYFSHLRPGDIPYAKREPLVRKAVTAAGLEVRAREQVISDAMAYLKKNWKRPGIHLRDHLHQPVVEKILLWKSLGARIVYITARHRNYAKQSGEQIATAGLPIDGIFHVGYSNEKVGVLKADAVTKYESSHVDEKIVSVAFLDDQGPTIAALESVHPAMASLEVTISGCEALLVQP
ncbi:MAG: hypothetical protein HY075_09535 [Deltaproteobacteria bacterium]|nr:hypothetical protein [Deltaproteobacteria bacterium]